jgi:hypothetical protein
MNMNQDLDLAALARVLSQLSGDLVLVIDAQGLVLSVATGQDTPAVAGTGGWEGRPWADTVTPDTRPKVGKMLQELASVGSARRRELNHPVPDARSVAFAYHAVRLGPEGLALAMGRDLGPQTALQQRLLAAQREVEAARWSSSRGVVQSARSGKGLLRSWGK